ncbi:hypothetical protein BKA62DRAFT_751720 [Auriculariales sp. MPI-PUGE-AT-0066]|nr:hypothetical protein BKA62DRAFT_751720 [Auriculariales sp. MPI-PUGE-AT-0066]
MDAESLRTGTSRSPSPEPDPDRELRFRSRHARMSTLSLATSTIDDLTLALTSFSSPPTPEPLSLGCCCGRGDECETTKSWNRVRAKLERGLTLSGEVGQALLQRHENYVRKYHALEEQQADTARMLTEATQRAETLQHTNEELLQRVDAVTREMSHSEKRLGHALVSHDVSDVSNKALLQELDNARAVIERLSTQNARSAGWDLKLAAAVQEMDDTRAELDSERMRNRVLEAKAHAASERCNKLEADLHYASEQLDHLRTTRSEFSEEILSGARNKLRAMQTSTTHSTMPSADLVQTLQTLVADNELLKKDTAELQNLLAESREDNRVLRDELEEAKANVIRDGIPTPTSSTWYHPSNGRITPSYRTHRQTESLSRLSAGTLSPRVQAGFRLGSPRAKSPRLDGEDLLAPSSPRLSVSSKSADDGDLPSKTTARARRASQVTIEVDPEATHVKPDEEGNRTHKPLMLLTRSRGVQTDLPVIITVPTPIPSGGASPRPSVNSSAGTGVGKKTQSVGTAGTPVDAHSDTSSMFDSMSGSHKPTGSLGSAGAQSPLGALVLQVATLLQRLREADVPTLSARLKRQQLLAGGGSSEQSGGAVGALAGLAAGLGLGGTADRDRQTRDVLGHLSRTTLDRVTREAGRLEALPDEVTAGRRELRALQTLLKELLQEAGRLRGEVNGIVLNPSGAAKFAEDVMSTPAAAGGKGGSKLKTAASSSAGVGGGWIAPISKLFGGGSPQPPAATLDPRADAGIARPKTPAPRVVSKVSATVGASIATAHVGFTKSGTRGPRDRDWVVLPHDLSKVEATATIRAKRPDRKRLSRNLDALHFDEPAGEVQVTRTLRGRGLSDSSIRSTFLQDAEPQPLSPQLQDQQPAAGTFGIGAMSKRIQGFRHYYPGPPTVEETETSSPTSPLAGPGARSGLGRSRMTLAMPVPVSPSARLLHGLADGSTLERRKLASPIEGPARASARMLHGLADNASSSMRSGSVRDESTLERAMTRSKNL